MKHKLMTVIALVSFSSLTTFAGPIKFKQATQTEMIIFCNAINQELEETSADIGFDKAKCRSNQLITSKRIGRQSNGVRVVSGSVEFSSLDQTAFRLNCKISYSLFEVSKPICY